MNQYQRFIFKDLNILGQHLQLSHEWCKMIKDRHYPDYLIQLLGELTAVAIMLANGMKHSGKLSLQISGKGYIKLLVVEVRRKTQDSALKIRGVAKVNQDSKIEFTDNQLHDSTILLTLNNSDTNTMYQSQVAFKNNCVAKAFEEFLKQSDQLETKIYLAVTEYNIAGLLMQKMPKNDNTREDCWNRVNILASSVTDDELLELNTETLLYRLFNEDTIKLFAEKKVKYQCNHDKHTTDSLLLSMGYDDVIKIIKSEGEVIIHNDMCNKYQRYSKDDIEKLFKDKLNA